MDIFNPWPWLLGLVGYNFARHLAGKPTLCSTARDHVPAWLFLTLWAALTSWLAPHYCRRWEWWKRS